tara:strand:- start:570 stop:1328 length:759 start_codon:yes stop_codon:yes gene_type:complete
MSKDLLKDAIADAKALRETAIANAKLALEEAFTPKIESMLSDQIAEVYHEDEEVEEMEVDDEEELVEAKHDDEELDDIIKELEEAAHEDEEVEEMAHGEEEEMVDEAIDLDLESLIAELSEMEMDDEEEMVDDSSELEEAYNTIEELRGTLNEVNLLNAKLLYSLKLFKSNNMGDTQKASVIETFDRANSVREVKLIYTTISESLRGTTGSQKKAISEGLASKPIGSTKPTNQPIVESNGFSDRMRKLAGLL